MIKCLIVDDEQHAINNLVRHVNDTPFLQLAAATLNPLEALEIIRTQQVDIVFLDVQMPEISGIDFIKTIKGRARVILTTAYSEYALEGYDLEVVDYLLKPVAFPRFLQAAQKALNLVTSLHPPVAKETEEERDRFFFVKSEVKGKMVRVNFDEIDYIESLRNYVAIHHGNKKTLALQSLKEIEDRLLSKNFIRIHRSYIVAIDRIISVEGNTIMLKNSSVQLLLGETYKAAFFERMRSIII